MSRPLFLAPERPADASLADAVIARAFGPGRYAKAAERLREDNEPIAALSFVAWIDGRAVGCVRMWPVSIGDAAGLLLGPIAVDASERSLGIGAALIRRACDAARLAGHKLVLLVGDEAYFGAFGFAASPARRVKMPGPVNQARVLVTALAPGAIDGLAGLVRAAARARLPNEEARELVNVAS